MNKMPFDEERYRKIRDVVFRYQSAKTRSKFIFVVFAVIMLLTTQLNKIGVPQVRYIFYAGTAVQTIMFIRLYFALRREKKQCIKEMAELEIK